MAEKETTAPAIMNSAKVKAEAVSTYVSLHVIAERKFREGLISFDRCRELLQNAREQLEAAIASTQSFV